VNISTETAVAYTEYFRDVATKIMNHDYLMIGNEHDTPSVKIKSEFALKIMFCALQNVIFLHVVISSY